MDAKTPKRPNLQVVGDGPPPPNPYVARCIAWGLVADAIEQALQQPGLGADDIATLESAQGPVRRLAGRWGAG